MAVSAQEVKKLRDRTGAGMLDCKNALEECDGDIDAAVEYLKKKGMDAAGNKAHRIAAEGLVDRWIAEDASEGVLVEVNSETDFVARNDEFVAFVRQVARSIGQSDAQTVAELDEISVVGEDDNLAEFTKRKIAKLGENIQIRRFTRLSADGGVVGAYIHAGGQIGVLVEATGDSGDDAETVVRDVAMHVAAMNPPYLSADDIPEDVHASQEDIFSTQANEAGKPEHIVPNIVKGKMKKWRSEQVLLEQPFVKNTDKTVGELADEHGLELVTFERYEVGEGIEKEEANLAEEVAAQLEER